MKNYSRDKWKNRKTINENENLFFKKIKIDKSLVRMTQHKRLKLLKTDLTKKRIIKYYELLYTNKLFNLDKTNY